MINYLIDTHAHIDMLPLEETLSLMQEYGVKKAIIPSVEVGTMDKVLSIAENNENIFAMLGIFPSEAKTYTKEIVGLKCGQFSKSFKTSQKLTALFIFNDAYVK